MGASASKKEQELAAKVNKTVDADSEDVIDKLTEVNKDRSRKTQGKGVRPEAEAPRCGTSRVAGSARRVSRGVFGLRP
jgi:hypothetical protein